MGLVINPKAITVAFISIIILCIIMAAVQHPVLPPPPVIPPPIAGPVAPAMFTKRTVLTGKSLEEMKEMFKVMEAEGIKMRKEIEKAQPLLEV